MLCFCFFMDIFEIIPILELAVDPLWPRAITLSLYLVYLAK